LGEEVYLRALTGYLVGAELVSDIDRLAIIALPDRICMALAAAVAASYISKNGYAASEGRVRVFEYAEGVAKRAVSEFKPSGVLVIFGGEAPLAEVREAFAKTLEDLRESGFSGTLVVHVRILLATDRLKSVAADPRLAGYLASLREVRTFTADLATGKFEFHRVSLSGGAPAFEKYGEAALTAEHVALLKASLPPK